MAWGNRTSSRLILRADWGHERPFGRYCYAHVYCMYKVTFNVKRMAKTTTKVMMVMQVLTVIMIIWDVSARGWQGSHKHSQVPDAETFCKLMLHKQRNAAATDSAFDCFYSRLVDTRDKQWSARMQYFEREADARIEACESITARFHTKAVLTTWFSCNSLCSQVLIHVITVVNCTTVWLQLKCYLLTVSVAFTRTAMSLLDRKSV